jgi:hypothetical protein
VTPPEQEASDSVFESLLPGVDALHVVLNGRQQYFSRDQGVGFVRKRMVSAIVVHVVVEFIPPRFLQEQELDKLQDAHGQARLFLVQNVDVVPQRPHDNSDIGSAPVLSSKELVLDPLDLFFGSCQCSSCNGRFVFIVLYFVISPLLYQSPRTSVCA